MKMAFNPEVVFKSFQDAIQFKPTLDQLEVLGVNCVLHKAIERLLIFKELLPGPERPQMSGYTSPAVRMKERERFVPPDARLSDNLLLSQQLKWHTSFILDLFEETLIELEFQGSQVYLEYTLCCETLKVFDNQTITTESQNYNTLINYLQDNLKNYKHNNKTQQYLQDSTGPCLDKAVVNVYAEENLGTMYGSIREKTRTEKNVLKLTENERTVQQLNERLSLEAVEETIIHQEINSHLDLLLTELTTKVEHWTNKYNTEINQLDIDLLQMKSQKDEQTTALETLLKEFTEKKEIMTKLQAEYDEREREIDRKLQENKMAAKIQRWWKQILFKRKLLKRSRNKSSKTSDKKQNAKKKAKK